MTDSKVAVVTGAASGIGACVVTELQSRGWKVAGLDLKPNGADLNIECDVSDFASVANARDLVSKELGIASAVASVAGHYEIVPVVDITEQKWQRMLHVHLGGAFNLAQAFLPDMVSRKSGAFVAVTSELAIGGGDQDSHYAAAKGGIIGLVRSLSSEMAPHGVRVNAVAPGPTDTPLLSADSPWRAPEYLETLPIRRLASPEEIALTTAFLIEDATFLVGEIISPNSGAVI
jgi:NAD(P)-dependent dehydrogenase (short-subunit alcohol dehydrogenase family)